MTRLYVEVIETKRKEHPLDITVQVLGEHFGVHIKEVEKTLLYALVACLDQEKEWKVNDENQTKKSQGFASDWRLKSPSGKRAKE